MLTICLAIGAGCALPTQPSRSADPDVAVSPPRFVLTSAEQTVIGEVHVDDEVAWEINVTADWILPVEASGIGPGAFVVQARSNLCGGAPRVSHLRVVPGPTYVVVEQGGADLGLCTAVDRREPEPWRPRAASRGR